jgi:hypothetical protein
MLCVMSLLAAGFSIILHGQSCGHEAIGVGVAVASRAGSTLIFLLCHDDGGDGVTFVISFF